MKKDVKSLKRPATMNLATTCMLAQHIASGHEYLSRQQHVNIVGGITYNFLFHRFIVLLLNNHRVLSVHSS